MEENKKNHGFLKGALTGALVTIIIFVALLGSGILYGGANGLKINKIKNLIDDYYLYTDEVSDEMVTEGIYKGAVEALGDPYSVYYDEEETRELYESTSGKYSGIGVVFSQNQETKVITAVQVYAKSPAKEAGVKEGDILYKVDGEDISGQDLSDIVKKIRGEENTIVELTVLRGEKLDEVSLTITRRKIEVETVSYEMKEDKIGYIRVTEFDSVTGEQFEAAIDQLESQGMQGLVIDLRANPGGNLDTVAAMLDRMLPEGLIVYTEDKNGNRREYRSDEEHQFNQPLAVLVDGNSASASEIFAGAIQDYKLGPLVGTTTYGKGIVQQIIDLKDGTCMKLTIAEYFTPKGRNIHKKGIEPDVKVEYEPNEKNPDADNQLEQAIKEVKNQL